MEVKTSKVSNTLGMFDIVKGIGIIFVIVEHTIGLFGMEKLFGEGNFGLAANIVIRVIRNILMPIFFVVSGYGFRVLRFNKISAKKQFNYLIKPYVYIGISATILHFFRHYFAFRYVKGAFIESMKVAAGFLFGIANTVSIKGMTLFANGASWYILTLFFSWMILLLLCQVFQKKVYVGVAISMLIGWILCIVNKDMPFCLNQSLIGVGFLYTGYIAKKKKWFTSVLPWYYWVLLLVPMVSLIYGEGDLVENIWKLGPVDMIGSIILASAVVRGMLRLNGLKSRICALLGIIGSKSFLIFCIHSVEMIGLLWYIVAERFIQIPWFGVGVIFGLRCLVIYICMVCIYLIKRRK